MSFGGESNFYVDPWQEYKAISSKLKKRFLRKPNVAEATREFNNLSVRMKEEECTQYAGLCKLAAARCEHQVNNFSAECAYLKEAARLFMECEIEKKNYNFPSFGDSLNSSIHCYGHAIKCFAEQKCFIQAGHVCLELGKKLLDLDRPYEAVEYFDKAIKFYKNQPFETIKAYYFSIWCRIFNDEFRSALDLLQKVHLFIHDRYAQDQNNRIGLAPNSNFCAYLRNYLEDVETTRILIIFYIAPDNSQTLNEEELKLKRKYLGDETDILVGEMPTKFDESNLDSEQFLALQSFLMALKFRDFNAADLHLTILKNYLTVFAFDLADNLFDHCKNMYLTMEN